MKYPHDEYKIRERSKKEFEKFQEIAKKEVEGCKKKKEMMY